MTMVACFALSWISSSLCCICGGKQSFDIELRQTSVHRVSASGRKRFCAIEAAARMQLLLDDSSESSDSEEESFDNFDEAILPEEKSKDGECDTNDSDSDKENEMPAEC